MEQVDVLDINLEPLIAEAQEAEKTLGDLKDEVKSLRKELDECALGSDEFESKLSELTAAQNELKNATKTTNTALEGSYDALVIKMSELKKEWRATADETTRNDIGEKIAEINSQLKEMDASIGNYQRNVGDYASAFDNVTMKIEGGVAKFERFNNVSRSIIGSFDLVEGGLKAIGVESEEVNSLMDKMQGAMMLTNGLTSIKEGVQAFNSLRVAVNSATVAQNALNVAQRANPIGIIITAVSALVAGLTALVGIIRRNKSEEEQLRIAFEATNKAFDDRNDAIELEIRLMKARGATSKEMAQYEILSRQREISLMKEKLSTAEKELDALGVFTGKQKKAYKEQIQSLKDRIKDEEDAVKQLKNDIIVMDEEEKTKIAAEAEQLKKDNIQRARDEAQARIEEAKRAKEGIIQSYKDLQSYMNEYWLNEYQKRELQLNTWLSTSKKTLEEYYKAGELTEEQYQQKLLELDKIFKDQRDKLYEESSMMDEVTVFGDLSDSVESLGQKLQKSLKLTDKQWESMITGANLTATAFGNVTQVLNTLSSTQDKTTKEGFEKSKKLAIAAATMSMLQGIVSAWTSSMSLPMPAAAITGGIMTGFTATMGGLQIAEIKKQSFDKPSDSTASIPQINTSSLMSSPVNYTTEVAGAKAEEEVSQRVYVLESDITSTQNRVKTVEDESTY